MKAITLRHPWPYCICFLGKDIENRTWKPSPALLASGDFLAIHGGAYPKGDAWHEAEDDLFRIAGFAPDADTLNLEDIIKPGIVAVCRYAGVLTDTDNPWFNGPYGWWLKEVVVLPEPVPCKGKQGLWDLPPDVLALVRDGYRQATKGAAT